MTDYTRLITVAIGVTAATAGVFVISVNQTVGGALIATGLGLLGYGSATYPAPQPKA